MHKEQNYDGKMYVLSKYVYDRVMQRTEKALTEAQNGKVPWDDMMWLFENARTVFAGGRDAAGGGDGLQIAMDDELGNGESFSYYDGTNVVDSETAVRVLDALHRTLRSYKGEHENVAWV